MISVKPSKALFALALLMLAVALILIRQQRTDTLQNPNSFFVQQSEDKKVSTIDKAPESNVKNGLALSSDYSMFTYEQKLDREKKLNESAVRKHNLKEMSGTQLYEALVGRGAELNNEIKERLLNESLTAKDWEYLESYMAQLATQDENFRMEIASISNFSELKNRVEAHSKQTGQFYGNVMLNHSKAYKDASATDIITIVRQGAVLPDNAIKYMISQDNIDLADALSKEGVNINPNYVDEFTSMNLIEIHADKLASNPFTASIDKKLQELDKLSGLGAPIKLNDGTRDALDIALSAAVKHQSMEAEKLLQYAVKINQMGVPLEQSHTALLNELSRSHPDLYNQYSQYLK